MVHALKEAHRVLVPQGTMVDVRPLSVDVPLEILCEGGRESAGMIDTSPDIELDIAADKAIESILIERIFIESSQDFFDFAYYWKTIKDMEEDLEEFWKDDVILPEAVTQRAHKLMNKRRSQTQIRVGLQMKLGKYEKLG
jgi:hypothetical protein